MGKLSTLQKVGSVAAGAAEAISAKSHNLMRELSSRIGGVRFQTLESFKTWLLANGANVYVALELGAEAYGLLTASESEREADAKAIREAKDPVAELVKRLEKRAFDTDTSTSDGKTRGGVSVEDAFKQQAEAVARASEVREVMDFLCVSEDRLLKIRRVMGMDPDDLALSLGLVRAMRGNR